MKQQGPAVWQGLVHRMGLCVISGGYGIAEEQGNAPDSAQTDQSVNDPADGAVGTAEGKGHQIEAEHTDGAPVQAAYDGQDQCNFIDKHA